MLEPPTMPIPSSLDRKDLKQSCCLMSRLKMALAQKAPTNGFRSFSITFIDLVIEAPLTRYRLASLSIA